MEQFEEQPCLHDENEDTAQETGHYKLPEGAVAAHKVDEDFWSAVDSAKKKKPLQRAYAPCSCKVVFYGAFCRHRNSHINNLHKGKRLGEKSCYRGRKDKLYASCG